MLQELNKPSEQSEVLIVIPTLGTRVGYLRNCISSLIHQAYLPKVVVGYPKMAEASLRPLFGEFPDVTFIIVEGNISHVINQISSEFSHMRWMNWIGDDDSLPKESISSNLEILNKHPKSRGVFGACLYIDSDGHPITKYTPPKNAAYLSKYIPSVLKLEGGLFLVEDFLKSGGINPEVQFVHDIDIVLKLRHLGKWQRNTTVVANFRLHAGSISYSNKQRAFREAIKILLKSARLPDKGVIITLFFPLYFFRILLSRFVFRKKESN